MVIPSLFRCRTEGLHRFWIWQGCVRNVLWMAPQQRWTKQMKKRKGKVHTKGCKARSILRDWSGILKNGCMFFFSWMLWSRWVWYYIKSNPRNLCIDAFLFVCVQQNKQNMTLALNVLIEKISHLPERSWAFRRRSVAWIAKPGIWFTWPRASSIGATTPWTRRWKMWKRDGRPWVTVYVFVVFCFWRAEGGSLKTIKNCCREDRFAGHLVCSRLYCRYRPQEE